MSLKAIGTTCPCNETLLHPTLYSKTGVYRGIHFLPIFNLKHRLWVLVRTACEAVLTCTNNLCFEQKYENNKKSAENCHFYRPHGHVVLDCDDVNMS